MIDHTEHRRQDVTVWIELSDVSMDITYDCTFTVTRTTAAPGQRAIIRELHNAEPIHISYSNGDDEEIVWHYGDNMPLPLVKVLDALDGTLDRKIREALEETL